MERVPSIFDADLHVTESQADILPYMEGPFAKVLRRASDGDGLVPDQLPSFYPEPGYFSPAVLGRAQPEGANAREHVVEAMEMLSIDHAMVDPTLNLYLSCVHHDDVATALASAYNDWLLDEIVDPDEGIYGTAVVAPQQPTKAAEEIEDRRRERGIIGVMIPSGGLAPPLGNERYDPIFDACESAGLPVVMHGASGTMMMGFPSHFRNYDRVLTNHIGSHPMQHISHLSDMIVRGVPERFPDLTVVMQEAGIGWIPYMMRRLDSEYETMREDAPLLERMPSEYLRDQFYFTTQPLEGYDDPEYVVQMLRLAGVENVMLSTDYPHFDFDFTRDLVSTFRELDDDERKAICGENALDVFEV